MQICNHLRLLLPGVNMALFGHSPNIQNATNDQNAVMLWEQIVSSNIRRIIPEPLRKIPNQELDAWPVSE